MVFYASAFVTQPPACAGTAVPARTPFFRLQPQQQQESRTQPSKVNTPADGMGFRSNIFGKRRGWRAGANKGASVGRTEKSCKPRSEIPKTSRSKYSTVKNYVG